MILDNDIIEIGKFQKTHALKGELNALLDLDEDYILDGHPIIVNLDGINVPFYADSIRPKGSSSYLIKLEGIDDVSLANKFVNKIIFGLRKDLLDYYDSPEEEYVSDSEIIGYSVISEEFGLVGEAIDLDDSTVNTLLIVENPNGDDIYIPFNDEYIIEINSDRQEILVRVQQELIDLNKKSK